MNSANLRPSVSILMSAVCAVLVINSACQQAPQANANFNSNVSSNANMEMANSSSSPSPISALAAKEPDKYRATLTFTAQTEGGDKAIGIPTLTAEVARNGDDRRLSFKLPDGSDLIYLEHAGVPYIIAPARKQYAELTPEATGFKLGQLMTPGQLVTYLDKLQGIEPAGEETVNGRTALKYRYARTGKTNTSAGEVSTESYFYVDKDTGLPLRTEIFSEASGNVEGVKAAKIVAEMRDIDTNVDPGFFEVPKDMKEVPPEQVRQQIDAITNTVAAVIKTVLTNMSSTASPPPPSPSPSSSAAGPKE